MSDIEPTRVPGDRPGDRRGDPEYPHATDAEVEAALAASAADTRRGGARPVAERARIVKRVAALFTERADELGALITREMGNGRRRGGGRGRVLSATIFDYYADNGPALLADRPLPGHDGARVEHLPVGALLGVMPWNYPYYQVARFAAPNLVVGNTVILKHAENCPTSALAIAESCRTPASPTGST